MLLYVFLFLCVEDGLVVLVIFVDFCVLYCFDLWEVLGGWSLEVMDVVEIFVVVYDGCLLLLLDEMIIVFYFFVFKDFERKNCKCYC